MYNTFREHKVGGFFVLLIFCIFIFSVMFVLMFGARLYNVVSQQNELSLSSRTCMQYITELIRQHDTEGAVYVAPFSDADDTVSLFLFQEIDGLFYATRIYYCNGAVYELFSELDSDLSPEDGNYVLATEGLTFEQEDGLITIITQHESGSELALSVSLRTGKGARE